MKKFLLSVALLAGAMSLSAATVTFVAGTDKGSITDPINQGIDQMSKDGISIAITGGCLGLSTDYRVYKYQTLSVTSEIGPITAIHFTCTANGTAKQGPGNFVVNTGTYDFQEEGPGGDWFGEAEEVIFSAESNQVRATEIVVTTLTMGCFLIGEVNGNSWAYNSGVELAENDGVYSGEVTFSDGAYFAVATTLGASGWDDLNINYRYGPEVNGTPITEGKTASFMKGGQAFNVPVGGSYTITVDFNDLTLTAGPLNEESLQYRINDNGTSVSVIKSDDYQNLMRGGLVIPKETILDGVTYPVTGIDSYAFSGCSGLTSVTIPNSVASIDDGAFSNCSCLTSVTIPNSVTIIGSSAFSGTAWLNNQPDGLVYAGIVAYKYKGDMPSGTSIIIKDGTKGIAGDCFSSCSGLTSVSIPNSVTSIGYSAFYGCSGLTSVTIPNSVTEIGDWAFSRCSGLMSVKWNAKSCSDFIYIFDSYTGGYCTSPFKYCYNITSFEFGDQVERIPAYLCYRLSGLTSVTIPEYVTSIGYNAFDGCSGLTSVKWDAKSCADSGYALFLNFTNIYSFEFGNLVEHIPAFLCYGLSGLTSVTIPNSVTSIGGSAFDGCSGLTSVTIPNSVTSIGGNAFSGCSSLTSVSIPNSVTSIGPSAFYGCSGLTSVTIPNSVTSVGQCTFSGCSGLTSVTIPNSVTSIDDGAFSGCTGLQTITIPNSVTSVGWRTFSGCSGLTSVTIPNSVTFISSYAFENCTSLTGIKSYPNPANVSLGTEVFSNVPMSTCKLLVLAGYMSAYKSANQWRNFSHIVALDNEECLKFRINDDGTSVSVIKSIDYKQLRGGLVIPKETILDGVTYPVTGIDSDAFSGCSGLTSVTIPEYVTTVGDKAFSGCSGLTEVKWNAISCNDGASSGVYAPFSGLSGITSFELGSQVEKIPSYLCYGLGWLSSVTIPTTVTEIGSGAFDKCSSKGVYITDMTAWCNITFSNAYSNPLSCAHDLYLNNEKVGDLVIPNVITSISSHAFYGCTGLQTITIPNSVTAIGETAFALCSGLTDITSLIENPAEVSLGDNVFVGVPKSTCTLWVPKGTVDVYKSLEQWKDFLDTSYAKVSSVSINMSTIELLEGDELTLEATVLPTDADNKILYWTSNNPIVATVDQNGKITAKLTGTATITATSTDGSEVQSSCVVSVLPGFVLSCPNLDHLRGISMAYDYPVSFFNVMPISALQFIIKIPKMLTLATDSYGGYDAWLDDNRKTRNHTVQVEPYTATSSSTHYLYQVLISSPSNNALRGNDGILVHFNLKAKYHEEIGDFDIGFADIVATESNEIEHAGSGGKGTVHLSYLVGDANADAEVDIADYVCTANYILNREIDSYFYEDAANANYKDNIINATDLVAIVNYGLELKPKEIVPSRLNSVTLDDGTDYAMEAKVTSATAKNAVVNLALDNNRPLAALQLDLDLPSGVNLAAVAATERAKGLDASVGTSPDGKARIILAGFGNGAIEAGFGDVLTLTLQGDIRTGDVMTIDDVTMAERDLTEHSIAAPLLIDISQASGIGDASYDHVAIYVEHGSIVIESPIAGYAQLARLNGVTQTVEVKPGKNVYEVTTSIGDVIITSFNGEVKKFQF